MRTIIRIAALMSPYRPWVAPPKLPRVGHYSPWWT